MTCKLCVENAPREKDKSGTLWVHPQAIGTSGWVCGYQEETNRQGDWVQTWTGRQFWALDPRPEDFHILDIAAGMRNPRYSNQCILTETVGEHAVLMYLEARRRGFSARDRRTTLMHDGSEYILVDICRPIKRDMPDYTAIEGRIMHAMAARYDFDWPIPPHVKELDNRILNDEMAQNMGPPPAVWRQLADGPLNVTVRNWSPEVAMIRFLHACAIEGLV